MKDKFERYVQAMAMATEPALPGESTRGRPPGARDWPFTSIRKQFKRWKRDTRRSHLWVIVRGQGKRKHTKVGCSSDLRGCLLENAQKLHGGTGGNRSKEAAEEEEGEQTGPNVCKMAICVGLPPMRNYSAATLQTGCAKGKGYVNRCFNALVQGLLYGLDCSVSHELLARDNSLYIPQVAQVIRRMPVVAYGSDTTPAEL